MADRLDFEIDVELEAGLITGHARMPGLIEAFRQSGTAAAIDREIMLKRGTLLRCAKQIAQALAGPPRTRFALKRPASAGV
jgi:hypothetical protein